MRFLIVLLVAALCDARPSQDGSARAALSGIGTESYILGGTAATPGEFPWQLSQQRLGAQWSHSCGAVLLGPMKVLSAAHCVDGAAVGILRVIAGLHDRSNEAGAVISTLTSYTKHPRYNLDAVTFSNDIATFRLNSNIMAGGNIGYATLPPDNFNNHAGETCVMSGWGRTSASNVLPNILQKVNIEVLTEAECNTRMAPVSGASVGPGQICLFDRATTAGSCNGDSGGPLNCQAGPGRIVSGITSWGIQGGGQCLPTYPSVYTRTSFFLTWIADN